MHYYNKPFTAWTPYDMCLPTKKDCTCNTEYNKPMYMPMEYPKPNYMPMDYIKPHCVNNSKKCVKVPEVIGRNYCQILLENIIPFPSGCPAYEIKDIKKDIKELHVKVCQNKVMINGKLHKNINYKTLENIGKSKNYCTELDLAYGNLRHVSVTIPFSGYIEIPGAKPGDDYQIEYAGVEDCCEEDTLMEPVYVKYNKIPVYRKLKEKVILKIDIKVLRPTQITVSPEEPNICP